MSPKQQNMRTLIWEVLPPTEWDYFCWKDLPATIQSDSRLAKSLSNVSQNFNMSLTKVDREKSVKNCGFTHGRVEEPNVIPGTISPFENEWHKAVFLLHLPAGLLFLSWKNLKELEKEDSWKPSSDSIRVEVSSLPSTCLMQKLQKTQRNSLHFNISIMWSSS